MSLPDTFTQAQVAEFFDHLDTIRICGGGNIWAADRQLARDFNLVDADAAAVLMAWMATFSDDATPEARAAALYAAPAMAA